MDRELSLPPDCGCFFVCPPSPRHWDCNCNRSAHGAYTASPEVLWKKDISDIGHVTEQPTWHRCCGHEGKMHTIDRNRIGPRMAPKQQEKCQRDSLRNAERNRETKEKKEERSSGSVVCLYVTHVLNIDSQSLISKADERTSNLASTYEIMYMFAPSLPFFSRQDVPAHAVRRSQV